MDAIGKLRHRVATAGAKESVFGADKKESSRGEADLELSESERQVRESIFPSAVSGESMDTLYGHRQLLYVPSVSK